MNYTPVIGLEIHVELATRSKMFCQCDADWFGKDPNTNTCPVCLGLPGALPVPNRKAIEWTQLIGKALGCTLNKASKFDRKHYFYPDLPKGYQISQYDEPFCSNGKVMIGGQSFRITRVHLEEDTGKLIHKEGESLIDFNRSGVPLVEIVTEPDFDNSDDAKGFLIELQTIIKEYLQVSDADMEKGSMRLEPNISLKKPGEKGLPPYKVEVKNINSFRFVQKAIEYELKRQKELLDKGETPLQETRGYNENKGITFSQRSKEEAHDYRYFPEPDIPAMKFNKDYIDNINVPELPQQTADRLVKSFAIKEADAYLLTRKKGVVEKFERIVKDNRQIGQKVANIIINAKKVPTEQDLLKALDISSSVALDESVVEQVLSNNKKAVSDYKSGKENALMFLVGCVMRELKGQADPTAVKEALKKRLTA